MWGVCYFVWIARQQAESSGSSVDPEVQVEHMEVQQSPGGGGDSEKTAKSDDAEPEVQAVPPPKKYIN